MAVIVSNTNQKGGTCKTTTNIQLANYIALRTKYKVHYIDCDFQKSSNTIKTDDLKRGLEDLYEIQYVELTNLMQTLSDLNDDYDVIIVDMPGNITQEGIQNALALLDIVLIPTRTSNTDIASTVDFIKIYKGIVEPEAIKRGSKPEQYLFLAATRSTYKSFKEFQQADKTHWKVNKILKSHIPEKIVFQEELNTISVIPEAVPYCKEALEIIENKIKEFEKLV